MEVRCQSANWQLCCGKDLLLTAENPSEINLKDLEWNRAEFLVFPACFPLHLCIRVGVFGVWAWVRNAWPCWEEWLLYSCLVGTMGARAVSLGSCMDDLRRSPSFIKRTPTCRIDLAKKQGGNSSSSVFPNHKSLGGVPPFHPPPAQGKRWHHCQCCSPIGQGKGAGPEPSHIWWFQDGQKNAKRICVSADYRNNPGTKKKKIKATKNRQDLGGNTAKSTYNTNEPIYSHMLAW